MGTGQQPSHHVIKLMERSYYVVMFRSSLSRKHSSKPVMETDAVTNLSSDVDAAFSLSLVYQHSSLNRGNTFIVFAYIRKTHGTTL